MQQRDFLFIVYLSTLLFFQVLCKISHEMSIYSASAYSVYASCEYYHLFIFPKGNKSMEATSRIYMGMKLLKNFSDDYVLFTKILNV